MCKPKTGWLTLIGILWKWASKPTKLVGDGECRLTRFHSIRNFLANDIYHFSRLSHQTGCLFNLLSHFCLFQNAILHEMMKLGFRNFKPIFLRMQFSLVATFFFSSFGYQFQLIFASYNQLPDTTYLTLWKPNGLSKHLKGQKVIGLDFNLGFNLNYFSFYCKLFYIAYFQFFYSEINEQIIHNSITNISSFQNGLNDLFSSTGSYLE